MGVVRNLRFLSDRLLGSFALSSLNGQQAPDFTVCRRGSLTVQEGYETVAQVQLQTLFRRMAFDQKSYARNRMGPTTAVVTFYLTLALAGKIEPATEGTLVSTPNVQ